MSAASRLALIAAGHALAFAGGLAAVAVNELRMPADIAQGSPGMVAFGDVILFLLVAGLLSLAPTWFLLRRFVETASGALLAAEFASAAIGPVSWIAVIYLAVPAGPSSPPTPGRALLGLFVAFGAIPRIIFGPVVLVVEAATSLLVRAGRTRALLAAAMLMDIIPPGLFALHMAGVRHS